MFGFRYLPQATPTPLPSPTKLKCTNFIIPYYEAWLTPLVFTSTGDAWTQSNEHTRRIIHLRPGIQRAEEYTRDKDFLGFEDVRDMTLGPDGTIWLSTMSGVTQFNPQTNNWTSHIIDNGLHAENVQQVAVLPSRDVLVHTDAGLELLDASTTTWQILIDKKHFDEMKITKIMQRDQDILLSNDRHIWRVWRDEKKNKVVWDLFWETDKTPKPPLEKIYDLLVEENNTIWMTGYSREQGNMVAYLAPNADNWRTFSYRASGGAFGAEPLTKIAIAPDHSIWLNEGSVIVHGLPLDKERTQMQWLVYDRERLGLLHFSSSFSVVNIAAAPDNALWFSTEYIIYRCNPATPPQKQ